jgi:beta-lactamase superfamily II metal-dependent hydrolase
MSPAPPSEEKTAVYSNLMAFLAAETITVTEASAGETRAFGTASVTVLSASDAFDTMNDRSLVCRVDYESNRFLI